MQPAEREIVISLNGEERRVPEGISVAGLLAILSLPRERVAVEHNRQTVPKALFDARTLADGDRVEVVHFVGGE